MPKTQKKTPTLNEKPQVIRKSDKVLPKVVKKVTTPENPTGDSKQSMILALLRRPTGSTIDEMAHVTGWQRHSVHGMMSGVLRKKLGLTIASERQENGRVYRITGSVNRL